MKYISRKILYVVVLAAASLFPVTTGSREELFWNSGSVVLPTGNKTYVDRIYVFTSIYYTQVSSCTYVWKSKYVNP